LRKGQQIAVRDTVKHVNAAITRGAIRNVDPDYVAYSILGLTGQLVRTFVLERDADPEEVADIAIAFILEGILAGRHASTGAGQA
jgi:hypothetical protein